MGLAIGTLAFDARGNLLSHSPMRLAIHDWRTRTLATLVCCASAPVLVGCDEPAEIRVQDAPKMAIEEREFAGLVDPQDTILAALVPFEGDAWVFRLSGARDDVEAQRENFEAFVASLSLADGQSLPDWELPPGWEATAAAPGAMRQASIRVPVDEDRELDLSVSRLPVREDWLHYCLRNFNRWRRQLQLPVGHATDLAQSSESVELARTPSARASVVTVTGTFQESGHPTMGLPPVASPPTRSSSVHAASPTDPGLSYQTPPNWQPGPASSVRRASFVVREGEEEVSVTVTAFPNTGSMADPMANINRWRREVFLPPVGAGAAMDGTEPFAVNGEEGLYVPLEGSDDAAGGLATRAVMVQRGNLVWFFKMHGPKSLVTRETDHFQEFVRSVEFSQ